MESKPAPPYPQRFLRIKSIYRNGSAPLYRRNISTHSALLAVFIRWCKLEDMPAQRALSSKLLSILILLIAFWIAAHSLQAQSFAGQSSKPADEGVRPHISSQQAQELFRSLDSILKFASADTKLPILRPVKHALASRDEVERNLNDRLKNDKDAQRLQRSEIVLKKFGLIPRDFDLRSYLTALLREQVAGFYNAKDKTMYLMDWIPAQQQQPVMAHELTHALQDQNFNLEQWLKARPAGADAHAGNSDLKENDAEEIAADEAQATRQALVEGQGMAVLIDYLLKDSGQSVLTAPAFVEGLKQGMTQSHDSPVFSRGPLYLRESLAFPYRYGLGFVQALLTKGGKDLAYAGALRNPPRTTRQIMTPQAYLDGEAVVPLQMPAVSAIFGNQYELYDTGSVGQFDVMALLKQFSGEKTAEELSSQWRAGGYYAAVKQELKSASVTKNNPRAGASDDSGKSQADKSATAPLTTGSIALLYLSRWATPEAASSFAAAYAAALPQRYKLAREEQSAGVLEFRQIIPCFSLTHKRETRNEEPETRSWMTDEGPVLIEAHDKTVLVLEGFDHTTLNKIRSAVFKNCGTAESGNCKLFVP